MADTEEGSGPRPVRLALTLALFAAPGAVAAAVLWHDVLNELLAGRPMQASAWTAAGMLALLAASVAALAWYLNRFRRDHA